MSSRRELTLVAVALMSAATGSGCAATSCPAASFGSGVHIDATAWATSGLDTASVTGSICLAGVCEPAAATSRARPADLFLFTGLPSGPVVVRVQLSTSTGRTLDVSTSATVQQVELQGGGCGSTSEIDLAVDSAGRLQPGKPRKLGNPPTAKPTRTLTRPSGLPKP